MFYVKTDGADNVLVYPYTLTDLRHDNPQTSFPSPITDEVAADFDCYPVTPSEQPPYDHTKNLTRTAVKAAFGWNEVWLETDATAEEIAQRIAQQEQSILQQRDQKLAESDWTQLLDSPVDQPAWAAYRTELRAIEQQVGYPWEVTWPTEPSTAYARTNSFR